MQLCELVGAIKATTIYLSSKIFRRIQLHSMAVIFQFGTYEFCLVIGRKNKWIIDETFVKDLILDVDWWLRFAHCTSGLPIGWAFFATVTPVSSRGRLVIESHKNEKREKNDLAELTPHLDVISSPLGVSEGVSHATVFSFEDDSLSWEQLHENNLEI